MKTITALLALAIVPQLAALPITQTATFENLSAFSYGNQKNHVQRSWTYDPFDVPDGLLTSVQFTAAVSVAATDSVTNGNAPGGGMFFHTGNLVGQFDFPFALVQNGSQVSGSAAPVFLSMGQTHSANFNIDHTFSATFTSPLHLSMFDGEGSHTLTAGLNIYPNHWLGSLQTVSAMTLSLTYNYADVVAFSVASLPQQSQPAPAGVPDGGSGLALAALACAFLMHFRRVVR